MCSCERRDPGAGGPPPQNNTNIFGMQQPPPLEAAPSGSQVVVPPSGAPAAFSFALGSPPAAPAPAAAPTPAAAPAPVAPLPALSANGVRSDWLQQFAATCAPAAAPAPDTELEPPAAAPDGAEPHWMVENHNSFGSRMRWNALPPLTLEKVAPMLESLQALSNAGIETATTALSVMQQVHNTLKVFPYCVRVDKGVAKFRNPDPFDAEARKNVAAIESGVAACANVIGMNNGPNYSKAAFAPGGYKAWNAIFDQAKAAKTSLEALRDRHRLGKCVTDGVGNILPHLIPEETPDGRIKV